jgi:hypothetical protein
MSKFDVCNWGRKNGLFHCLNCYDDDGFIFMVSHDHRCDELRAKFRKLEEKVTLAERGELKWIDDSGIERLPAKNQLKMRLESDGAFDDIEKDLRDQLKEKNDFLTEIKEIIEHKMVDSKDQIGIINPCRNDLKRPSPSFQRPFKTTR